MITARPNNKLKVIVNIFFATWLLFSSTANAEWSLSLAPEYFYLEEESQGEKILDERGLRIGISLFYEQPKIKGWLFSANTKAYFGSVDYDGQLQGNVGVPVATTTDYQGYLVEARAAYRFVLEKPQGVNVDLIGGLGGDFWDRELGSQYGYNEKWSSIYFTTGIRFFSNNNSGRFGEFQILVPFRNESEADITRLGKGILTHEPKTKVGFYIKYGYKFNQNVSTFVFLQKAGFAKSPSAFGYVQPESISYRLGLGLTWDF